MVAYEAVLFNAMGSYQRAPSSVNMKNLDIGKQRRYEDSRTKACRCDIVTIWAISVLIFILIL